MHYLDLTEKQLALAKRVSPSEYHSTALIHLKTNIRHVQSVQTLLSVLENKQVVTRLSNPVRWKLTKHGRFLTELEDRSMTMISTLRYLEAADAPIFTYALSKAQIKEVHESLVPAKLAEIIRFNGKEAVQITLKGRGLIDEIS